MTQLPAPTTPNLRHGKCSFKAANYETVFMKLGLSLKLTDELRGESYPFQQGGQSNKKPILQPLYRPLFH